MAKAKVAVTIEEAILEQVDRLVKQRAFSNRSQAFEEALSDKLSRMARTRLARESARLDPRQEREMAEEGILEDEQLWPPF